MPKLVIVNESGTELLIDSRSEAIVMEAIRDAGGDELLALCGGVCSCETCHVYVDPAFADILPPMSQDETELLETSSHRTDQSRLSCQLRLDEGLSGLRVTVAPED